jgi:hypothetical protein
MTQNNPAPAPPPALRAFRLVNSAHSPTALGSVLPSSQASNMKIGVGIYFAETEAGAVTFFKSHHGYEYTHFLECSLAGVVASDFFDRAAKANELGKFKEGWTWTGEAQAPGDAFAKARARRLALYKDFAVAQGKKGLRWEYPGGGWIELVLHEPHCAGTVTVVSAVDLATWKAKHNLP